MHIYSSQDNSPFRVFQVAQDLTGGAFTAVKLTSSGVQTCAAGDVPIGILSAQTQENCAVGDEVNVVANGGTLWLTSEDIDAGDLLTTGANGLAKKAEAGNFVFAQALESGLANSAIKVLIVRAGKM